MSCPMIDGRDYRQAACLPMLTASRKDPRMNIATPTLHPPVARLSAVRKAYGAVQALDGIDLDIQPGEVLALLGANGAGKSTAISILLGLTTADGGEARLFDQAPQSLAARRRIGVMLQTAALPEANTVHELIEAVRAAYPDPLAQDECLRIAGLVEIANRRYGTLSGGQQRRVQFALAICGQPRLLFLDEPTTGLDIAARQQLWTAIRDLRARGAAVLLTTHYLEEAEALADRVVVIDRGRLVAEGSVDAIRAQVSRQRIRCRSTVDEAMARQWPGVRGVQRENGCIAIEVEDAVPVLRHLLAADAQVTELEVARAGLAEAYLAMTAENLQEETA